jgi:hypothetical protein
MTTSIVAALNIEAPNKEDDKIGRSVLAALHAMLYTQGQDSRVFWYHASSPDFIFDPTW